MRPRLGSCLLATVAIVGLTGAGKATTAPSGLNIYFVDVLGGAATLIVTPEKESILIDSGWPNFEDRDPKRIVHLLKDVAGLDHLDHLVTTHWHTDHYGGVEGLSRLVRIDHFWDRGLPDLNKPDRDIAEFPDGPKADDPLGIAYLKASQGKRKALKAGDSLPLKGSTKALVLASSGHVISVKDRFGNATPKLNALCADSPPDFAPDRSDNARSLVLKFRLGAFDFLDAGDLTWNMEKALVCPVDLIGPIDLYQVTHHGMGISNHPVLVQTIAPTVAVMDNGPTKGGSPSTAILLKRIASIKAFYALHKNASTPLEENADPDFIANKTLEGGQFIQVNVTADGSRYSVRIGTDGAERTFDSK